jgi:calcium-dependent protein kinase
MTTIKGTPYYIAPEVLKQVYDEKCDIWSCGVILYIMLCGYPPFNGDNEKEIMKSVMKGVFDFPEEEWSKVSEEARNLVSNMLKYNPKKRYSAKECLSSEWIKNNQEIKDDKKCQISLENLKKFKVISHFNKIKYLSLII